MSARAVLQGIQFMEFIFLVAADILVEVTQVPENIYSIVGTDIAFNCIFPTFQDDSDVNVYWWKLGGKELIQPGSDSRKRFVNEKGRASFQLLNVSVQDSGVYHCGVAHLGNRIANGSGSQLVVSAPPTPVRIVSQASESNVSGALALVCEMASFYPEALTITWYKNNVNVETGIHTTKQLSRAGMYEASSYFEEAQSVQGGTVYVCLVSHATLQVPAMAIYLVPNSKPGGDSTSPSTYLRIFGCIGFALAFLVLMTVIRTSFRFVNCKVSRQRKDEANNCD
ncbi:natural cytotoxicity triggering receptor 3 ligand 1-like [Heterodontus francisci]|uniref:natural cytotoxicity triggering receptor 3 ligand 1-like n=1 Tax=Heterodontus francisci TaxID=7792 RepID=UPI00355B62D3